MFLFIVFVIYLKDCRLFPNCIIKTKTDRKRIFVADEVEECRDHSSIFFLTPAEKGYIGWCDIALTISLHVVEMGRSNSDVVF